MTKNHDRTQPLLAAAILSVAMLVTGPVHAEAKLKLKSKFKSAENLSGLTTVSSVSMAPAAAGAQIKDELFAGAEKFAQGASEVTEINLDPSTMGIATHSSREGALASKMNFMVLHSYKYDKPGMYSMDDFEVYSKKLADGTWNCSIRVRSKTASTDICSRTLPDHETNEMVILTAAPRDLTFIHMSGKMSLSDLNRMSEESSHGLHIPSSSAPSTTIRPLPTVNILPSPAPAPAPTPVPLAAPH